MFSVSLNMKTNVVRRVVKIKMNSSVLRVLLLKLNKQQPSNVKIKKDTTKPIKK